MTTAALILAAVLAIAAVLFVARPFLRSPGKEEPVPAPSDAELQRLRLLEDRDRSLAALKELEFDHRTGKISDADYAETVIGLRREAAEALAALDGPPRTPAAVSPAKPVDEPQPRG